MDCKWMFIESKQLLLNKEYFDILPNILVSGEGNYFEF